MDEALLAYCEGLADGCAGHRNAGRAGHPATGADYRRGFLDGRLEVFRMLAGVRQMLEGA
ncbi:hypothetical protein [Actinoplanes sp. TFC3]|uniref:hypothetical protein n=1 Tax=Actinoplanes sp. TFC3 TaxID=1710355 RepID=UPI00082DFC5C|nr:hypothetical protein [Actinoplanes sp. TFC3]